MIFNLNHSIIFILIHLYLFYSVMERAFTKNKTLEHGGSLRKNLYLLVPNYYQLFYIQMLQPRTLRKSQLHLIYVSLGNIPIWRHNKLDAKQLLGYLPILEAANKDLVCKVFYESLCHLLEPIILLKNGIDLVVNNERIWFYSRVSTIIADWPEAASFCLVYKSPIQTFHFTLVWLKEMILQI